MALTTLPTNDLSLTKIGGLGGLAGAEISGYDAASKRLFTTASTGLQIIDISNPSTPVLVTTINLTLPENGGHNSTDITSVAVKNGIVAVTVPDNAISANDSDKANNGVVVFFSAATGSYIGTVEVGAHPDMITFTPDGKKLLVANEGELAATPGVNGEGSVSIIDVETGVVTKAGFQGFDGQEAALRAAGVRISAGVSASLDFEPEYIAVSADGKTAMITLQENNAVAILNIATATITSVVPLGLKDWSLAGNVLDASDDGPADPSATRIRNEPIFSMYMPDGIGSYQANGQTYYVMANEGDDRDDFLTPDETIRAGNVAYDLDNTVFPNEVTLKTNAELGRLTVSKLDGDTDNDGDYDKIVAYGGRSFSIVDAAGNRVFDSAGVIEQVIAQLTPALHNADSGLSTLADTRSDNKGPEPESVTLAQVNGRTYAFVAIERSGGGTMVFDVTDPANVTFTTYARDAADVSPEGVLFISAADSPNGKDLLILSNEFSNTVAVYETQSFATPLITGTSGNDQLIGTAAGEIINAGDGQDLIQAKGGADTVDGGVGNDTISYSDAAMGVSVDLKRGFGQIMPEEGVLTTAPSMLQGRGGFTVAPLVTIGETLANTSGALNSTTAGNYTPTGILDGIGAYAKDVDTVRVFVNSELGTTAGSTYQLENGTSLKGARIHYFDIDKTTKAIVDGGLGYGAIYDRAGNLVTSSAQLDGGALGRFCSGGVFEANQFGASKGITDRIYFAGEESANGSVWALDTATGDLWALPEFGRGGWENVAQVDTGTTDKVAFLLGDDGPNGMPMYLYVGTKNAAGDFLDRNGLKDGQLYVWKANTAGVNSPAEFATGTAAGTWVAIEARDIAKAGQAGYDALGYKNEATLRTEADALGAFSFSRPEDLSTNPLNGTQVAFTSTGASIVAGNTADNVADATDIWGTVYKMDLDFSNINAPTGSLTVVYNGNTDPNRTLRSPDNLDWGDDGYLYINEDRSTTWTGTPNTNDASILRMDPVTGALTRVATIDRSAVPFGQTDGNPGDFGNWESSGVLDVSTLFGLAGGSLFITDVQAHSINLAGLGLAEGGQLALLAKAGVDITPNDTDRLKNIENILDSAFSDLLIGNDQANNINGAFGDDVIDGGLGNDTLNGNIGTDTVSYASATAAVKVSLAIKTAQDTLGAGRDTITNFENIVGSAFDDMLIGTGNINAMEGGAGNDKLIGGIGADKMFGGTGNDIFYVDHIGDETNELAGEGTLDRVFASVNYTLGAGESIELLYANAGATGLSLAGNELAQKVFGKTGNDTLSGDGGADFLFGGAGNDRLIGGAAKDALYGQAGEDTFVLQLLQADYDIIGDFVSADDQLEVSKSLFADASLNTSGLTGLQFIANNNGLASNGGDATTRFVYNTTNGVLYYDADGSLAGARSLIGVFNGKPMLTAADFNIVA